MAHFSCSPVVQGPFQRSPGNSPYRRPFQSRHNDYWPKEALRASPAINNQSSVNQSNVNQSSKNQVGANQSSVNQSSVNRSNVNQSSDNQSSVNQWNKESSLRWGKKRNLTLSLKRLSRNQFSNWLQICDGRSKKVLYVSSRSSTYVGSIAEWSATTWLISFWGVAWWKQSK